MNQPLPSQLEKMERLSKGSRIKRLTHHPFKYILAQGVRFIVQKFNTKGLRVETITFWKEKFTVELPAGTDIYLIGGKSDDSEIRLAKFMILNLKEGDVFIDIGSHFGYFSRLALTCTGEKGKVFAIEPSKRTFTILQENLKSQPNAVYLNCMAGEDNNSRHFYQFPVLYSEYNTAHPDQFNKSSWFKNATIESYAAECITIDQLVALYKVAPTLIKIDTEGSEFSVIKGAIQTLKQYSDCRIVMEYLSESRGNISHKKAAKLLYENGFNSFLIDAKGLLYTCPDIEKHLTDNKVESDNIIFLKKAFGIQ